MSLLQNSNAIETGGYPIQNSLRFQSASSQNANRTFGTATSRTTFTLSQWIKRGSLGSFQFFFDGANEDYIGFTPSDTIRVLLNGATIAIETSQVFRDPSAWYHIVFTVDSTQATASNRMKLFINGVQVTAFATTNYPALNATFNFNAATVHRLGTNAAANNYFFDGYMTEVNFIDGQALTPSSFGETNTLTGQWVAKKYNGTYGTNGFYLPFIDGSGTGSNSFTYSEDFSNAAWVKLGSTTSSNTTTAPNGASNGSTLLEDTSLNAHGIYRTITESNVTRTLSVYAKISNVARPFISLNMSDFVAHEVTAVFNLSTGQLATVTGANANYTSISTSIVSVGNGWYRCSLTATKGSVNPNNNLRVQLCDGSGNTYYTGGGTSFGTFIWGAQAELSSAVGPYYSTVASAQASTLLLGKDYSVSTGGYNNWTLTNFTRSAGVSDCWMYDVPSGNGSSGTQPNSNYCVLNPLNTILPLSGANLIGTQSTAAWTSSSGTIAASSGKYYYEASMSTIGGGNYIALGLMLTGTAFNQYAGSNTNSWSVLTNSTNLSTYFNAAATNATTISATSSTAFQVAVDIDAGKLWLGYNNNWLGGGNPASGTSPTYTFTANSLVNPIISGYSNIVHINCGQRSFAYTPPSGFKALCTANLPASTIVKGNEYMDATLYTGTGSTQSITNAGGFSPDLVWLKKRGGGVTAQWHMLADTIRGTGATLSSNATNAEYTGKTSITAFNSNGFTLGADSTGAAYYGWNIASDTYVGWQWDAGSSTVTNTDGSISSQVRANPTAGVSVVTWTGTGSLGTVGHGLGVAPSMLIIKSRSTADTWRVYHASLGNTRFINLNDTSAAGTASTVWNNTSPSSTVFTVNTESSVNGSGRTQVAYCFAEIAGYSKFGFYTGNGSADGTFTFTGFTPKFIMTKRTNSTSAWVMIDTSRSSSNVATNRLYANESSAEDSADTAFDILSNGFKCRTTNTTTNASGGTYIYMAFAENPFANANAR